MQATTLHRETAKRRAAAVPQIDPRWLALGTTAFLMGLACGALTEHFPLPF